MLKYILLFNLIFGFVQAQEIREFIDLQIHPTMHVPYPFFGKGLKFFKKEPNLKYKHFLKNVNYANYLKNNKGVRIIVTGALNKETVKSSKKAKKVILKQIKYINDFANENSEDFVVAKTPQEVRDFVKNTNKTIIIHSIEGGKKLINNQEDANFWASQGVAFITLIHLVDVDYGSSAIMPGFGTHLINLKGSLKKESKRGGLTEKGKNAIKWLANAGIMTDLTHMSDMSRIDALKFMEENKIPPITTHDLFRPIQNHPRGLSETQILQIYKNNGFVSLPISGYSLMPYKPEQRFKNQIDSLKCYCEGSIDTYKFTYEVVKNLIQSNTQMILNDSSKTFENLNEIEKVRFSIGFQSDFNGWLNHSRPRYGKKGCYPIDKNKTYEPIDIKGLAHPGLIHSQWKLLESESVDLEPIKRNAEKFLQLWEYFLNYKNNL